MTTVRRTAAAGASLAAAVLLALAAVVGIGSGAQAAPEAVPLSADFGQMVPGGSASQTWTVDVAAASRITATTVQPGAGADWTARLCGSAGACLDLLDAPVGARLAAGEYRLTVGVTVRDDLVPGSTTAIEGRVTFAEVPDDDELASTGSATVTLSLAALALATLGLLLFLVGRRRRSDDTEEAA